MRSACDVHNNCSPPYFFNNNILKGAFLLQRHRPHCASNNYLFSTLTAAPECLDLPYVCVIVVS